MAPRPSWKGYLKLSLVSCPVALFPASGTSEKISFHMLNEATGNRLKQQYVDAETEEVVEREERVKGYEVAKGEHVVVTDEEIAHVRIESSHNVDIEKFVPRTAIDPIYHDARYYMVPDDKVGQEAFAVIRETMSRRGVVGIARVVLFGKERTVMLEPRGRGLLVTTLRYAYEVREDGAYFDDIPSTRPSREMLRLASHVVDTKVGEFDPAEYGDRFQDAVVELIRAKSLGREPPKAKGSRRRSDDSLVEALRKSLATSAAMHRPTKDSKAATAAKQVAVPKRVAVVVKGPAPGTKRKPDVAKPKAKASGRPPLGRPVTARAMPVATSTARKARSTAGKKPARARRQVRRSEAG